MRRAAAMLSFGFPSSSVVATDYIVFRRGRDCAVVEIEKTAPTHSFCRITSVTVLARPECTRWIDDAAVDTGSPSALAEKARTAGIGASETLVVNGLYEHVNFIHRPAPRVIHLFDMVPPEPPRLLDLTRQVVAYGDFPALVLEPHIQTIPDLVRDLDNKQILFPCGVSQLRGIAGAFFLDERPARQDWVLVGCEKSRLIHRHMYGVDCACIELCPRTLFRDDAAPALMRCCRVERTFEMSGSVAVVPWGAERSVIESALRALVSIA